MNDLVSVIIPTYNRWTCLNNAVKSVLAQTYTNIECIVIDDCSTDENYNGKLSDDPRLTFIRLKENMRRKYNSAHAQGMTRNEGIKIASGKYLAFLDDDDWWEPNKLEIQLKTMKEQNAKFCSTNAYRHYNGKISYFFPPDKSYWFDWDTIKKCNLVICSSVVIEKKLVVDIGMFNIILYEDMDLWLRILNHVRCYYIHLPLTHYDSNHGGGSYFHTIEK